MSGVNSAIVRRTWGLLQSRSKPAAGSEKKGLTYGKDFQYEEFMQQKSWGMAFAMSGFIYGVGILLALFKPVRLRLFVVMVEFPGCSGWYSDFECS